MVRLIFTIFAIAIAGNFLSEAKDLIHEFLDLSPDTKHELVSINFADNGIQKRDTTHCNWYGKNITLRAFGKDINLWIHPKNDLLASDETPVYFAIKSKGEPGDVRIIKQKDFMKEVGKLFEDPKLLASLVIGKDEFGRTTVDGRIESKNLVIRSLPDSVVKAHPVYRRSTEDVIDKNRDSAYHIVYKGDIKSEKNYSAYFDVTALRNKLARSGKGVPYTIYPKVLFYVDYTIYKHQGFEIKNVVKYVLTLMNGVDLKYRSLKRPNFRFHIGGIVIAMEPAATPFIANNAKENNKFFETEPALSEAKKYFYDIRESIPLSTYDIAVAATKITANVPSVSQSISWSGSICEDPTKTKSVQAVITIVDFDALISLNTVVYSLGSLFGLPFDGHWDGKECLSEDGFIMSYHSVSTLNSSMFSNCSMRALQKNLEKNKYACMYKTPEVKGRLLPKLMPGRLINLDEFCRGFGLSSACENTMDNVCVNVKCMDEDDEECREIGMGALDGTECSNMNDPVPKYCISNRCVAVRR